MASISFFFNINVFYLVVFFSICILILFFFIFNMRQKIIFVSNLTIYYPLVSSLLSVSIRFMGLLGLIIAFICLFKLILLINIINLIEIFRCLFFLSVIIVFKHSYDSLSHLSSNK